ncbi:hypothetical protein [Spirosoma endophyticum]|nr:hypothetical protein [Spirosoma endophyticum]
MSSEFAYAFFHWYASPVINPHVLLPDHSPFHPYLVVTFNEAP